MADFEDLDVLLIDFETGQALVTYDTAKTIRKNSSRQRRCAVEAKPDQRFAIEIRVKSSFDCADSNGLEARIGFDVGEEVNCRSVYILRERSKEDHLDLPYFACDDRKNLVLCVDHLAIHDPLNGICVTCKAHFYFRHLRGDDLVVSKPDRRSLESQGKIRVEILRARISARRRESMQTDPMPTYRRQTRRTLLSKGITLEVLLRTEINSEKTIDRGNFKSSHSKVRRQQANFDFIYREAGLHDDFVDRGDIIEVGSNNQTPESEHSRDLSVRSKSTKSLSTASPDPQENTIIVSNNQITSLISSQDTNQGRLSNDSSNVIANSAEFDSFGTCEISSLIETYNQRREADQSELVCYLELRKDHADGYSKISTAQSLRSLEV